METGLLFVVIFFPLLFVIYFLFRAWISRVRFDHNSPDEERKRNKLVVSEKNIKQNMVATQTQMEELSTLIAVFTEEQKSIPRVASLISREKDLQTKLTELQGQHLQVIQELAQLE